MDNKLHNILNLALHPETREAEAIAALNAARRLASSIDELLNDDKDEETKVLQYTVPPVWQYYWIKMLVNQANLFKLKFDIIECSTTNNLVSGSLCIHIKISGSSRNIKSFVLKTESDIIRINLNIQTKRAATVPRPKPVPPTTPTTRYTSPAAASPIEPKKSNKFYENLMKYGKSFFVNKKA